MSVLRSQVREGFIVTLFVSEIVTPAAHLPITATDEALAAAVVEEIERTVLWRAVVRQTRRIIIDGPLPPRIELEPVSSVVSLTQWTPTDAAVVVDAATYSVVTRDPSGTILSPVPGSAWPSPARDIGSFTLTYESGWTVTPESAPLAGDGVNEVPASVRLMVERAVQFRAGAGLGDIGIGSLKLEVADSYKTDKLPQGIASIARAWNFRPGIFAARP